MTDLLYAWTAISQIKENPWFAAYLLVTATIWVAKNPKILYSLLTRFPRLSGVTRIMAGLGLDVNEILDGLSLVILGRVRKDKATQATIFYLDNALNKRSES